MNASQTNVNSVAECYAAVMCSSSDKIVTNTNVLTPLPSGI